MNAPGTGVLKVGKPREKVVENGSYALKKYLHQVDKATTGFHVAYETIKADAREGLRAVKGSAKQHMKTIDAAMLQELKKQRALARLEREKSPFAVVDAAMAVAHVQDRHDKARGEDPEEAPGRGEMMGEAAVGSARVGDGDEGFAGEGDGDED